MAKSKAEKPRFHFSQGADLKQDSQGAEVGRLQAILAAIGHLRGMYRQGQFCHHTRRAVRRYQRYYGLVPDGVVGPITKRHLEQPRCGVPDYAAVPGGSMLSAPYQLRGCQYPQKHLTYTILDGTPDLPDARARQIVRTAFDAWQNVADLQFTEVKAEDSPVFRIAWRQGDHGDGSAFDGPGNTLAHAFFPPPCGGPNSGDLHFDEGEVWIEDPARSGILLYQVAVHEIGHLLGLSHSEEQQAIMFAYYGAERVHLHQDDIAGIRALYGERSEIAQLMLSAQATGSLRRSADENVYEVSVPGMIAVSLDGPEGADYDLYVRKDAPPTESQWDFRAYTVSSDERITFPAQPGAKYYVMVRSYTGSGDYALKIESGAG